MWISAQFYMWESERECVSALLHWCSWQYTITHHRRRGALCSPAEEAAASQRAIIFSVEKLPITFSTFPHTLLSLYCPASSLSPHPHIKAFIYAGFLSHSVQWRVTSYFKPRVRHTVHTWVIIATHDPENKQMSVQQQKLRPRWWITNLLKWFGGPRSGFCGETAPKIKL